MRAALTSGLLTASMTLSANAWAAPHQTMADLGEPSAARILAMLATLALLYVVKGRTRRVVKMDAEGRRYDPKVRGLFDD